MNNQAPYFLPEEILEHILLDQNYISKDDWQLAKEYTRDHEGSIVHYLINRNILSKKFFGQAVAEHFKLPYIDFDAYSFKQKYTEILNKDLSLEHRLVVVAFSDNDVAIATVEPREIDFNRLMIFLCPK